MKYATLLLALLATSALAEKDNTKIINLGTGWYDCQPASAPKCQRFNAEQYQAREFRREMDRDRDERRLRDMDRSMRESRDREDWYERSR